MRALTEGSLEATDLFHLPQFSGGFANADLPFLQASPGLVLLRGAHAARLPQTA